MKRLRSTNGFTLVELLIVIVVIAILAAITIVAYNGITQKARTSVLQSDLAQAAQQLAVYNATNGAYPDQATSATLLHPSTGITFSYIPNYDTTANDYCLVATSSSLSSAASYYLTSQNTIPTTGACNVTNGLVGWWKLNGDATDASGNGNNGILTSATPTTGENGQPNGAYSLTTATTSVISMSNTSTLEIGSGNKSWGVWFKTSSTANGTLYRLSGNSNLNGVIITLNGGGTGRVYCSVDGLTNPQIVVTSAAATYGDNNWHFVACVLDRTNAKLLLYVDGALSNSSDASALRSGSIISGAVPYIGGGNTPIGGTFDDVRVYGRVLSAAEVQALYLVGAQ